MIMSHKDFELVDDAAHRVLVCLREGLDDLHQITAATDLENHVVNYRFKRLVDLKLIAIETPDGLVTRVVDGQSRTFRAPKRATLTAHGQAYFEWTERQTELDQIREPSHDDVMARVVELGRELARLQTAHAQLKEQLQRQLIEGAHLEPIEPGN